MAEWQNQLYQNYISGKMSDQGRSNYEADVIAGVIKAPEGSQGPWAEAAKPYIQAGMQQAATVPQPPKQTEGIPQAHEEETQPVIVPDEVLQRFWNGEMSDEGMKKLGDDFRAGRVISAESEDVPIFEKIRETISGTGKRVPETEALPSWVRMPEMNNLSIKGAKTLIGTMAAGPDEVSRVIKKQNPDVEVKQDTKGNYIFTSGMDGQQYAIKPGFRAEEDLLRGGATLMLYAMGSRGGAGRRMLGAGATQFGIEASQEMTGGKFDATEIPLAMLFEGGGIAAGKGAAALKGVFKGKTAPEPVRKAMGKFGVKLKKSIPTQIEADVATAEKMGVTPITSDVFPPKTFSQKSRQLATERIPIIGTGTTRAAQQETREQAVKDVLASYGADDLAAASDDVMKDLIKKKGADIQKYTKLKGDVIENLSGESVPMAKTATAIDAEVSKLKELGSKDVEPLIEALEEAKTSFDGKSLSQVEDLRKILGEKLKSSDLATVKSQAEKVNRSLYKAVNEDMGEFIKANGEPRDFNKWKLANKRLEGGIKSMKITALKTALKKGDMTPELVQNLLFSNKPSEIKMLYKSLTPVGKSRAKVAIYQKALEKAGGMDELSTAKFRTALKNLEKSTGVFFKNDDKRVLDGLKKVLDMTKRAEVAGVQPPTGVQNYQFILGSMLGAGTYAGGAIVPVASGSIAAVARAYESKPIRNLLIKIAKGKGGEEKYIKSLVNLIRTQHQLSKKQSPAEQRRALEMLNTKV